VVRGLVKLKVELDEKNCRKDNPDTKIITNISKLKLSMKKIIHI
jgi:hypothetical protein